MEQSIKEHGAVAQLGERCVRNAEVGGSTPLRSTLSQDDRRVCDSEKSDDSLDGLGFPMVQQQTQK